MPHRLRAANLANLSSPVQQIGHHNKTKIRLVEMAWKTVDLLTCNVSILPSGRLGESIAQFGIIKLFLAVLVKVKLFDGIAISCN